MSNHRKTQSVSFGCLTGALVLILTVMLAACGSSEAAPTPAPTRVPATATFSATPVPPTATLAPTQVPPTATLAPSLVPPTATLEPTLPSTATLPPTLPPDTATLEPTPAPATSTVDSAQPTLSIAMRATVAAENAKQTTAMCLGCHGPYEKLVAASEDFVTEDGEKVNPHTTVDDTILKVHESGKGIPNCETCHKPHPQPFTTINDVAPANVEYCYLQCHHQENFTPCSECHREYR